MHNRLIHLFILGAVLLTLTGSAPTNAFASNQLLVNPGFETGSLAPWVGNATIDTQAPNTGKYDALLCGFDNCNDTLYQSVSLPSTISQVVLSYWLFRLVNKNLPGCPDTFTVTLRTSTGSIISTVQTLCQDIQLYTQFTFDVTSALSSYHGQTIEVFFQATTGHSNYADFRLDDTALNVT